MPRSARQAFKTAMGREPGKVNAFTMPVSSRTPDRLEPAALYHYWHPERAGAEPCPKDFDRQLKLIHRDLYICRPPAGIPRVKFGADVRWLVWQRDPSIQAPICRGWKLLFVWPPREYHPIPLDNRIFANLAIIDPRRYRGGIDYFNRIIQAPMQQEAAAREKAEHNYRHDRRKDYVDATKIKNIGKGNKFSLFHDGGIVPSRGEANWLRETGPFLPADVLNADRETRRRATGTRSAPVGIDQHAVAQSQFEQQVRELRAKRQIDQLVRSRYAEHQRARVGSSGGR